MFKEEKIIKKLLFSGGSSSSSSSPSDDDHQSTDNTMRVQIPDYVLCNVADNNTAATADVRTI